jgi:hypothetical protein
VPWRAIAYDFFDQIRVFLGTGDPQFHVTFYKIVQAWLVIELCEPLQSRMPNLAVETDA